MSWSTRQSEKTGDILQLPAFIFHAGSPHLGHLETTFWTHVLHGVFHGPYRACNTIGPGLFCPLRLFPFHILDTFWTLLTIPAVAGDTTAQGALSQSVNTGMSAKTGIDRLPFWTLVSLILDTLQAHSGHLSCRMSFTVFCPILSPDSCLLTSLFPHFGHPASSFWTPILQNVFYCILPHSVS